MDNATLMHIAILPPDERAVAIEAVVDLLVRGGLSEEDLDRLERQVHQVNDTLAQLRAPH
jgi:hypothetical protein